MKSVRFFGQQKVEVCDVSEPAIFDPHEVKVKIERAGVCRSDLHVVKGILDVNIPITLGHEAVGTVAEIGEKVTNVKIGDKVIVDYVLSCGACESCIRGENNLCIASKALGFEADGVFTEYITLPETNVVKIKSVAPVDALPVLGCAVVTSLHAIRLSNVSAGDSAIVFGVGGVGYHAVQLLKLFGLKVIAIDISDKKLEYALKAGATLGINPNKQSVREIVLEETQGLGADVAFDFVGKVTEAIRCVRKGGKVVLVGISRDNITLNPMEMLLSEKAILSSMDHTRLDLVKTVKLVEEGLIDLSHSVSQVLPLEQANEAFRILEGNIGDPIRLVLKS